MELVALTMPDVWVDDAGFVSKVNETGVPLFVHTINDEKERERFRTLGVKGFYSDYF